MKTPAKASATIYAQHVISLSDASHAFHDKAHSWWAANALQGWASYPLVENGVMRLMSNPAYSGARRFSVGERVDSLSHFVSATNHAFWTGDHSLSATPASLARNVSMEANN